MSGFIGAGDILLNPKDPATGAYRGWTGKLYASRFALQASAELKELTSKGREDYGQVIGSVAVQQPATFNMTLRDADKDAITLLFLGTQGANSVPGGSVTDEVIVAKPGRRMRTAKGNISATVLTSSPSGTTYVLGTDYTVENARLGMIAVVPGSSLATAVNAAPATGLNLLIDYAHAAEGGVKISGATQPSLRAQVLFDGKNFESGEAVVAEIWEAVLTPEAGFDFLADDWNEIPLSGRMVTPAGKTAPFEVRYPTVA